MYDRVEDFLGHPQSKTVLGQRARQLHSQGQSVPGFDQPLHPKSDPRAAQLLDIARCRQHQSRELQAMLRFIDDMRSGADLLPRQELAVVVLARAMGLSRNTPAALFGLGRLAGRVTHVQEQSSAGTLLSPRASFRPGHHIVRVALTSGLNGAICGHGKHELFHID